MPGKRWLNHSIVLARTLFAFFCFTLLETPCAFSSEKSGLRDIKGPVTWPHDLFLIVAAGFFLFFLTGSFFYVIARKKKNLRPTFLSPHEAAYKALEALSTRDLLQQGRVQEYYEELSNIIRRYLESRFSYRVPEMTTEEFRLTIQINEEFSPERRTLLGDFLRHCDLVKFAGYRPQFEEMERSLKVGRKIIDQTKEEPVLR